MASSVDSASFEIFCACAPGLEPILLEEVRALGLSGTAQAGGVSLHGGAHELLLLNLWLRTAGRVLVRLGTFRATTFPELVKRAGELPLARVLRAGAPVALRATCRKSRLYHSGAVIERVHAALEAKLGRKSPLVRAATDAEEALADESFDPTAEVAAEKTRKPAPRAASQLILIRFENDQCTISADASGALLHRRGYRTQLSHAPLRETLAAGLLLSVGYRGGALLDPCCGGGTIPIEAALVAMNRAPGISRSFACESWPGIAAALVAELRDQARNMERPLSLDPRDAIVGSDLDPRAISAAQANAQAAGVAAAVQFSVRALESWKASELPASALLIANPPYGKRVGSPGPELTALWSKLGALARAHQGCAAFLCPSSDLVRIAGAPLRAEIRTQNGGLPISMLLSRR